MSYNNSPPQTSPLCVDLDGTLIKTDSLHELFLLLIKQKPFYCFLAIFWLFKSKAHFKAEITKKIKLIPENLPYNEEVIDYIKTQKVDRKVYLVTGSNKVLADSIASYLQLFNGVIASDSETNLTGENKKNHLVEYFGEQGFEYIGNDKVDFPVWKAASSVSVVSQDNSFLQKVRSSFNIEKEFISPTPTIRNYLKGIRLHQWVKNLLVFIPFFLDHRFNDANAFIQLVMAFLCLSLIASFTYIINDLLDLESDRQNQYKRNRPFASCLISIKQAVVLMLFLLVGIIVLLSLLSFPVIITLLVYLATTLSYSFYFKRIAILDVTILAGLFSLRVITGVVSIESEWSFWLLAFSMFFFLSLAFAKRYSEVENLRVEGRESTVGRGYVVDDLPMLNSSGIAAGYISILVIALYIESEKVREMYSHPEILWLICPLLLFWIGRIWLITGRGEMHEDPIVFAIKDKVSILTVSLCFVIVLGAVYFNGTT